MFDNENFNVKRNWNPGMGGAHLIIFQVYKMSKITKVIWQTKKKLSKKN